MVDRRRIADFLEGFSRGFASSGTVFVRRELSRDTGFVVSPRAAWARVNRAFAKAMADHEAMSSGPKGTPTENR